MSRHWGEGNIHHPRGEVEANREVGGFLPQDRVRLLHDITSLTRIASQRLDIRKTIAFGAAWGVLQIADLNRPTVISVDLSAKQLI